MRSSQPVWLKLLGNLDPVYTYTEFFENVVFPLYFGSGPHENSVFGHVQKKNPSVFKWRPKKTHF